VLGILLASSSWAELKDFKGQPHKLTDFTGKGKWTVVMFWASDCRVCNAEIDQYIQFNQDHKDKDASLVGISLDGESGLAAAQNFVKRHGVNFPNLLGDPQQIIQMYQSMTSTEWLGTPSFLVFDPKGKLKAAQAGAVPTNLIEKFIKENSRLTKSAS
jgi:peroxiredoxin